MQNNTSQIIDSILRRKTDSVRTNKIVLPDCILTDKTEIINHIKSHFTSWRRRNPHNPPYEKEWAEIYKPLATIDKNI